MNRRESKFQTRLNNWSKAGNWKLGSAILELKATATNSISFDAVSEKQVRNLLMANEGFFYHTWSDFDRMGTPADCIYLMQSEAFVMIQFNWTATKKRFYAIPIQEWVNEKETSKRKSLTEERAKEIGIELSF